MIDNIEGSKILRGFITILLIFGGSFTSVVLANQKRRLSKWANISIFCCGSIVGYTYYAITKKTWYVDFTPCISIFGYQIIHGIGIILNDPKSFKEIVKEVIKSKIKL